MFEPGLSLCGAFYAEVVRPQIGVPHAAALIGPGSEVLGFDTERSTDHDWTARVLIFVAPALVADVKPRLPATFRGHPVLVRVTTPAGWCAERLGFDATAGVTDADWLGVPTQRLAETVAGAVFHDDDGQLTALRERLAWYPPHVWRMVLAAQWTRIAQEEAFVGRAAEAGDDLGSRIVSARLARDVMRLCLLLERRYPPYSKWLGSAFAALPGIAATAGALRSAVGAGDAVVRQEALCTAYEAAGRRQNQLGLAPPVDATRRMYFDRPFPVIDAARFAAALHPAWTPGPVDAYLDNTDVLSRPALTRALSGLTHRDNP